MDKKEVKNKMMPRTWKQIVKQEGIKGVILGEDIDKEVWLKARIAKGKIPRRYRI